MSKIRTHISMSLDGCVAGPNQSHDNPLGEGGEKLHEWVVRLKTFKDLHGMESGGDVDADDEVFAEYVHAQGAVVMGRKMFSGGEGPWERDPNAGGWWGDDPPFGEPVFILTHHAREPVPHRNGTTFNFVTDGIESALAQAREAAGDKDVFIGGGASIINQYLAAGLVDEIELHVVPLLLGSGARLLEGVGPEIKLEQLRAVEAPGVTHLKYRVVR